MSDKQRLGFTFFGVTIAVVAVTIVWSSNRNKDEKPTKGDIKERVFTQKVPTLQSGKLQTIRSKKGDTIRFRVYSPVDEEVHVHGFDILRKVPAGRAIEMAFKANMDGVYEVEFHGDAEEIAKLKVAP